MITPLFFTQADHEKWDLFLEKCPMGTFLHSRKFLSYHKEKFDDKSLVFLDENQEWLGIFPAAVDPSDSLTISSHPGSSYGGIIHQGKLLGSKMIECFSKMTEFYALNGFSQLIYKAVPVIYHQAPSQDDLYALHQIGAQIFRRDISCTIDLQGPEQLTNKSLSKMRNMMRKSESNDLYIEWDNPHHFNKFWNILEENLKKRYGTRPVHTVEEIKLLKDRFKDNIKVLTSCQNEQVLGGTILFITPTTIHTQYLAVTDEGKSLFALDFLIQNCISYGKKKNFRFFDFGINTEKQGTVLNEPLYQSKVKHGGSGMVHDFYKISLKRFIHDWT